MRIFLFIVFAFNIFHSYAKETITIATNLALPPYAFIDEQSKPTGFEIDLLNKISEINDWEIKISKMPFSYFFNFVDEGKIDLIVSGLTKNAQREQNYQLSEPYYQDKEIIMYTNPKISLNNDNEIPSLKMGAQKGTLQFKSLLSLGIPEDTILTGDTFYLTFKLLQTKKVDAVIGYNSVSRHIIKERPGNFLFFTPSTISTREIVAVAKKGNTKIIDQFNNALNQLKSNGEYTKITQKWGM